MEEMNMSDNGKKPLVKPAIIIGLGGTGNHVVRRLKQLVQEQYGDTPVLLNFLVVDTDEGTFENRNWDTLAPLTALEKLPLYDPRNPFADIRQNPEAYPEIREWLLPTVDVSLLDKRDGAGQIRMQGRVALYRWFQFFAGRVGHFFDECQRIQAKLEAHEQFDFNAEADPVVYLVTSVCGGQGAGAFVDVAVALRELADGRFPRLNLIGVLVLPSVYEKKINRENLSRVAANTHAAMKELDYLLHDPERTKTKFRFPEPIGRTVTPSAPLFDLCHLIDIRNHGGALNDEREVFDQIATQLFLEIGTPFGARSESVQANLDTVSGLARDPIHQTGRRYSSFGNHTISINRERIVQLAALRSAHALVHDRLLGHGLKAEALERALGEFINRHRIDEAQTDDLVERLIGTHEIEQEKATAAWAQARPDHRRFADDLWARLDGFWQRTTPALRAEAERRARLALDGQPEDPAVPRGILADLDQLIDEALRQRGINAALELANALLTRLRTFEELMRAEHQERQAAAQTQRQEAERARTELLSVANQLEQLVRRDARISQFSRMWRELAVTITFGVWRPGAVAEEQRASQIHDLNFRAQRQRDDFMQACNQAVEQQATADARAVAINLYAEAGARLASQAHRLTQLKHSFEESDQMLLQELEQVNTEVHRSRFVSDNTMRRDVTADYVDQYYQTHAARAAEEVLQWVLPAGQPALTSLESHRDREPLCQQFRDCYARDILHGSDRASLAKLIEDFHTQGQGGGLAARIEEGLRYCLPFWDIRVPGGQLPTEVLLVGLDQERGAVSKFLADYAIAQKAEVKPQVVPTGQDSVILISRIAHGASYYWHAQDERYRREYVEALSNGVYPVHLNPAWRELPEPIPDPAKYEKRVFALGLAYELIAVRGMAYYCDPQRQYTLVGTTRQSSPDWPTILLLEAAPPTAPANPPVSPVAKDLIDDDSRIEALQKFVDDDVQVEAVRTKLLDQFNQHGRDAMRRQLELYREKALEPAIQQLGADDPTRHQLEFELAEVNEVINDLKIVIRPLKLSR
jgi:hypothetical protein